MAMPSAEVYTKAIKSNLIRPRFRLSLLNPDETVKEDVSEDIIYGSGSLSINYQQGQRRSLNLSLKNENGQWTPNPNGNGIWFGTKFKLELGLEIEALTANSINTGIYTPYYTDIIDGGTPTSGYSDIIDGGIPSFITTDIIDGGIPSSTSYTPAIQYWNAGGIFVVSDPDVSRQGSAKEISLQLYDKFSLLDGTLGGNTEGTYTIPVGTNIRQAISDTLMMDKGNGYPIDFSPLIFDSIYKDTVTSYTITKTPNSSLGEILIELANMISCDIYYNENGNLVLQSGIDDIAHLNKPILWTYSDKELEYLGSNLIYNFSKVRNRVTIIATNSNSSVTYSALSENTNPMSPTRVSKIGTLNYYLEDNNIPSDALAKDRADYELNKLSILQLTNRLQSTYMLHLDVNNCIAVDDTFFGFEGAIFIIQSLNIPIEIGSRIDIQASNIAELPFYTS